MGCVHAGVWQIIAVEPVAKGAQTYRLFHQGRQFRKRYSLSEVPILVGRVKNVSSTAVADKAKHFSRIFPECLEQELPDETRLQEVGLAMKPPDRRRPPAEPDAVNIPAAYTYFGQLIAHDLTNPENLTVSGSEQVSGSRLDLNSIIWPELDQSKLAPGSYVEAGVAIGRVGDSPGHSYDDLPRSIAGLPLIPDQRNDANLALAQLCVAIYKYHQIMARQNPWLDLDAVRRMTIRHIQEITVYDFLKRIIDPRVYQDILSNGRRILYPSGIPDNVTYRTPIEFSAACFRFGHSLVRRDYQWNDRMLEIQGGASTEDLLEHTFRGSRLGRGISRRLEKTWIADWKYLLPLDSTIDHRHDDASAIDACLNEEMFKIPSVWFTDPHSTEEEVNLAIETLLRGREFRLVSAQKAINSINKFLPRKYKVVELDEDEVANVDNGTVRDHIIRAGFNNSTPMWFYTLREADVRHRGQRLGPFGSRIVMETIHAAIEASSSGLIRENKILRSSAAEGRPAVIADLIRTSQKWCPKCK